VVGEVRVLEILKPGPLALIEDAGRAGLAAVGVSASGAFDRGAFAEVTLGGLVVRSTGRHRVALTGAPCPASVNGEAVAWGEPFDLAPADVLTVGLPSRGLRSYLSVAGGVDVPPVLGSRSTDLLSGLGPARLATGDFLPVGPAPAPKELRTSQSAPEEPRATPIAQELDATATAPEELRANSTVPEELRANSTVPDELRANSTVPDELRANSTVPEELRANSTVPEELRAAERHEGPPPPRTSITVLELLLGPRTDWLADPGALAGEWRISPDSNRVGVRLTGPTLARADAVAGVELPSEPLVRGALQLPPSGQPLIFGPDHPTTGGYPVVAVLSEASNDRLAQCRPGEVVRLMWLTPAADARRR
jgi:allophanate hydrolase subunit 2